MKGVLVLALLALGLSTMSQPIHASQDFAFMCKVEDFVIISSEDGKTKRYSNFQGSYAAGDSVWIDLVADRTVPSAKATLRFDAEEGTSAGEINSGRIGLGPIVLSEKGDQIFSIDENGFRHFSIGPNLLSFKGLLGNVLLSRYFKDDWHGVIWGNDSSTDGPLVFSGSLHCMNAGKSINGAYEVLFSNSFILEN